MDWLSDQDIIDMFYVVGAPGSRLRLRGSPRREIQLAALVAALEKCPQARGQRTANMQKDPRSRDPQIHIQSAALKFNC